jgi:hypothetical protein
VDEVSSGLDPLSRRKIWDILLAERGGRTIILTTHFLDEADLLSDHIAILSKGTLRAEGSAVELKNKLGGGYRVHLYAGHGNPPAPVIEGVPTTAMYDQSIYTVQDSVAVTALVRRLEEEGCVDYRVAGPTIEDVFLKLAEEVDDENESAVRNAPNALTCTITEMSSNQKSCTEDKTPTVEKTEDGGLRLLTGRRIGFGRQAWVLFRKRLTILRRNYLPSASAFFIPIIATGLVTLFLKGYGGAGCSLPDSSSGNADVFFRLLEPIDIVVGPPDKVTTADIAKFASLWPVKTDQSGNASSLLKGIHVVNTVADFNAYISQNFANVTPGGFFLGDNPMFAFVGKGISGDETIPSSVYMQNAMDVLLTNMSIATQFSIFKDPIVPHTGESLQLIVYFGLAMAVYPAFFALYPAVERLRNVRALEYSNGVRPLPLWLAYFAFDWSIAVIASAIIMIIFVAASGVWYGLGYLFVVFFLYAASSILLSYVISMFSKSQLAAFAFSAGGQAVMVMSRTFAICTRLADSKLVHVVLLILHFGSNLCSTR